MTPDEMRDTLLRAVAALNDPDRGDEYFEILYDEEIVLHGDTPEPLEGVGRRPGLLPGDLRRVPRLPGRPWSSSSSRVTT